MTTGLAQGRILRDEGMAQASAADQDDWDKQVIDQCIDHLCSLGGVWSANDLRNLLPEVRQPLIGERIRAAARKSKKTPARIVHLGYTPSTLPSTHAHDIKTWIGATS